MKNCEYWQQQISRLLDGDLTPEEEAALWEHIADCPDCARTFEEFSQQTSVLRAQAVRPPVDLSKLVMARIRTGQTDPVPFPGRAAEKPASHRLRPRRKLAIAACFVGLVAAAALTGIFSHNIQMSGGGNGGGMESAEFLPQAQSDTIFAQLPENTLSPAARAGQAAEEAPQAPAEQPEADAAGSGTQAPPAADIAPAQDARSVPEPAPEAGAAADGTAQENAAPAAADADTVPAEQAEAAMGGQSAQPDTSANSGIMTITAPASAGTEDASETVYIFTADGTVAGWIEDVGALEALLTGEGWQGEAPAVLYMLALDGTGYAFGEDENGALLWQRAGDGTFTLSPASLADLEALIVKG